MSYEFKTIYFDKPIVTNRSIDIFMPDEITRDIAIFFVHGGGWFNGTKTWILHQNLWVKLSSLPLFISFITEPLMSTQILKKVGLDYMIFYK